VLLVGIEPTWTATVSTPYKSEPIQGQSRNHRDPCPSQHRGRKSGRYNPPGRHFETPPGRGTRVRRNREPGEDTVGVWRNSRAYTLLELLVVLVVLSALAAVAVPTYNRVKSNTIEAVTVGTLEALERNGEAMAISDPDLDDEAIAETVMNELGNPTGFILTQQGNALTVTHTRGELSATGTLTFTNGEGSISEVTSSVPTGLSAPPDVTLYAIGDTGPGGGIVFYSDHDGFLCGTDRTVTCTYMEAAPATAELELTWAETTNQSLAVTGADASAIGHGYRNTLEIVAQTRNEIDNSAAVYASAYTNNGYDDWFLPAKDELSELYLRRDIVGGFTTLSYWSSTEYNAYDAWTRHFGYGYHSYDSKASLTDFRVRPVRAG
jgi:prepilin-type N-terminal cleavage/methylation domain-containing protein